MKTVVLGLDAFDPGVFEGLLEQGRMPHLGKYVANGNYAHFAVSNPPQSEVSWTSIATGVDPGSHGIFDFVLRDPNTYSLIPSLLPTKTDLFGTQFIPPHTTQTIFEGATLQGYPATALWWPATFPARLELPVQTIPGLGTPDVQGRLGVGVVFSTDGDLENEKLKTPVEALQKISQDHYRGLLKGPSRKTRQGSEETSLPFQLKFIDENHGELSFDKVSMQLEMGKWSPIFEVSFKAGLLASIRAITRAVLSRADGEPRLYLLPLQIHPLHSPWRYATPPGFVKDTWNGYGPFLTLGWPQDTTGLEEGWISDEQFVALCQSIDETREHIFFHQLEQFQEGVLGIVFDTLDRIQHMFLHDRPDIVEAWYTHLDALVGKVDASINSGNEGKTRLLILSDHGFTRFDFKVHLNRWLVENHYLRLKNEDQEPLLSNADWSQTQAYAIGLNSLYLNLKEREGQGCVLPSEIESLRGELSQGLSAWKGPDGNPVVQRVYPREEAFNGPWLPHAPDLVVGYGPGYRASAETGLGKWEASSLVSNKDHWHSDHCIDPQAVPGVLFANTSLSNFPHPSFRDIPPLAIDKVLDQNDKPSQEPPKIDPEDQKTIEERLKGLGYL